MAFRLGRVRPRRGSKRGWEIDFGRSATPRFLYSLRGIPFESREFAEKALHAIQLKVAQGVPLQHAVDEFAPLSSVRNRIETCLADYLAEQEDRAVTGDISPNHLRELRRCAGRSGPFSWWHGLSIHDISAERLDQWRRWLALERKLAPKTVHNVLGYLRAFMTRLLRLERIERVPPFPIVRVPDHLPRVLSRADRARVLGAIAWERRGAFLAACHGVRPGEIRALNVSHFVEREGQAGLEITRAVKGPNANAPTAGTKTGDGRWIPIGEDFARTRCCAHYGSTTGPGASLGPPSPRAR